MTRARSIGHRVANGPANALHEVSETTLRVGGTLLRILCPPLLRRGAEGRQQVVQVAIEGPEAVPFSLTLRDGPATLDATSGIAEAPRGVCRLYFPEVREAARRQLSVEVGGARVEVAIEVRPVRHWRIFLIHQSHLDIGYTDRQDQVLRHHLGYLDAVLDLAKASDGHPDDARFRWNVEATLPLERWLAARGKQQRDRFLELARSGRIEVTALASNMHTEAFSIDELARQLRFALHLRDEHQLPVVTAMQTDVPGATIGLLGLLADAGVRYLSVAHNYAGRSIPHLLDGGRLTRPFRWQAASRRELLTWLTDTPHGSAYMEGNLVGLADGYDATLDLLPAYLHALATRPYPYTGAEAFGWNGLPPPTPIEKRPYPHDILHLRVQGLHADNAPPSLLLADLVRRWNETWAYPHLRLATNRDFFETAEAELADRLDTFTGDWTDWWADGIGSAAREISFGRAAQANTPVAQSLHTLADALGGSENGAGWQRSVDDAYRELALFDEHTWGAANPWNDALGERDAGALQWQRKAAFARDAWERARAARDEGAERLAGRLAGAPIATALAQLVVLNPSGRPRTDAVRVLLPAERVPLSQAIEIVDETIGETLPYELEPQRNAAARPRGRQLRFVATDVPGFGYRRYAVRAATTDPAAPPTPEGVLENGTYRVDVDTVSGVLRSVQDLARGRELIEPDSPFGANQYVYDRYGSAPEFNHLSGRIPQAGAWLLGSRSVATDGVLVARKRTPIADRATVRLRAPGADWLESTVELLQGVARVDVRNRLQKTPHLEKESVYFAFPFRAPDAGIACEITGGAVDEAAPRVPGAARHFRAIRHWVALDAPSGPIAWASGDAPLVQIGGIAVPYAPFPPTFETTAADRASIFSWAMNNLWDTNFPVRQGGEIRFRYAIGSGAPGTDARELAAETAGGVSRPLVGVLVRDRGRDAAPSGSFLEIEGGPVDLVTVAPARAGAGITCFLQSNAAAPLTVTVRFPSLPVARARSGRFTEQELQDQPLLDGAVRVELAAGEYRALELELGR